MSIRIDPGSHVPIFQQIIDGLREAMAAGAYRPGEMLPSQRELAARVKVNPNTVHRAYDELEREGLVHARRGLGMFVTHRAGRSALLGAEEQVRQAMILAVRRGRSAGLSADRLRELFNQVVETGASRRRTRA